VESLLAEPPPGVSVLRINEISPGQTRSIGEKLGGEIERLTNSIIMVHGRQIQVNVLTAVDESNADALYSSLLQFNSHPFCVKKDRIVVEYVGRDIDSALAVKASYELGLVEKPEKVRYRVIAELGAVDIANYMELNPLFNLFLRLDGDQDNGVQEQIEELADRFEFGRTVALRNPDLGIEAASYIFQPRPEDVKGTGAKTVFVFGKLPERCGVPYFNVTMEITVDDDGFYLDKSPPGESLTAETPFWPVGDANVASLTGQITKGKTSNEEKVTAILEWLSPGRNLEYSGKTGSRWGVAKVLEQGFGRCWDFSDCFVTLARAAGVPSRQVAGWFYGTSGHVWAEYHIEGRGWQQVDPTGAGELHCGIYHIPYFTSEDGAMPILYLSAPQVSPLD
jgi:hypothetical protein